MGNGTQADLLRAVNDRIFHTRVELHEQDGNFACECGHEDCSERLELATIEYAARESQPLLAPGHKRVAAVGS
jgi:hypothetical protein